MRIKKTLLIILLIGFAVHCSGFGNIPRYWKKLFKPKTEKRAVVKKPSGKKSQKPITRSRKRKPAVPTSKAVPMQTVLIKGPSAVSIEANVEATFESFFDEPPVLPKEKESGSAYELGVIAGLFSGATALNGEIRFPLQKVFGPATTAVRYLFGVAQSGNAATRYYPVQADYIFVFPPEYITGVENYLGIGLNFTLYSTGGGIGMLGGQVCYGVQSEGFNGKLFGEIGYGLINSGSFSSSQKGISLLMGYRKVWPFY